MEAKQQAKAIVNDFYQPLGMVKQFEKSNSKQMWEFAQSCARTTVLLIINANPTQGLIIKPDYRTAIEYWQEVLKEIDNV